MLQSNQRTQEHSLSSEEFKFICQLVYDTSGIVLGERKREMVYRRLMRRTRELRISSFKAYYQLLKDDEGIELPNFINSITTNLTGFYREKHHFDYLKQHFIPEHINNFGESKRLRVWSSACSTGEEPYTLAITLMESMSDILNQWDVKILATDLDTQVVEKAKSGIYTMERIEKVDRSIQKKWFQRSKNQHSNDVKVNQKLAQLITFKQLNLLHQWPMNGPFDVIFCRNVLIYFDKPTQSELINRFHELLRPGGILMLGHSESIEKSNNSFDIKGRTVFEKKTKNNRLSLANG